MNKRGLFLFLLIGIFIFNYLPSASASIGGCMWAEKDYTNIWNLPVVCGCANSINLFKCNGDEASKVAAATEAERLKGIADKAAKDKEAADKLFRDTADKLKACSKAKKTNCKKEEGDAKEADTAANKAKALSDAANAAANAAANKARGENSGSSSTNGGGSGTTDGGENSGAGSTEVGGVSSGVDDSLEKKLEAAKAKTADAQNKVDISGGKYNLCKSQNSENPAACSKEQKEFGKAKQELEYALIAEGFIQSALNKAKAGSMSQYAKLAMDKIGGWSHNIAAEVFCSLQPADDPCKSSIGGGGQETAQPQQEHIKCADQTQLVGSLPNGTEICRCSVGYIQDPSVSTLKCIPGLGKIPSDKSNKGFKTQLYVNGQPIQGNCNALTYGQVCDGQNIRTLDGQEIDSSKIRQCLPSSALVIGGIDISSNPIKLAPLKEQGTGLQDAVNGYWELSSGSC